GGLRASIRGGDKLTFGRLGGARHAFRSSANVEGGPPRAPASPQRGLSWPLRRGVRPAALGAASEQGSLQGGGLSGVLPRGAGVRGSAYRPRRQGSRDRRIVPIPRLRRE